MKNKRIFIVVIILFFLMNIPVQSQTLSTSTKHFHWGVETWQMGGQDFQVHINEKNPVKIKSIHGYMTTGPQPKYKEVDTVIRQTLTSLTFPGNSLGKDQVTVTKNPAERFNQGVDNNFLSLNVKQTGGIVESKSIDRTYDHPIVIPNNDLELYVFNESYRYSLEAGSFVSKDQFDTLDVEIHLDIDYEVTN